MVVKLIIAFVLAGVIVLSTMQGANPVMAQTLAGECNPGDGGINLADCLKLSDDQQVSDVYENPAFLVNLIVRNVFILAGVILFLLIFYAGFKFFSGTKQGAEEGAKVLTTALVGFVIMFAAYWIVQIVELVTGANIVL